MDTSKRTVIDTTIKRLIDTLLIVEMYPFRRSTSKCVHCLVELAPTVVEIICRKYKFCQKQFKFNNKQ